MEDLGLDRKIKCCPQRNMVGELGLDYSGSRQKKKVGFVSMEMNFGFHKIRKMPSLAAELLKKDYAL